MKICPNCRCTYADEVTVCASDGFPLIIKSQTIARAVPPLNDTQRVETAIRTGLKVGEYEINGIIGEGGMGVIYSAIQPVIRKSVAIKVINKSFAKDPKAVLRFILEARSVNEIGHHNIVDIFSIGELDDGRNYLVMELLHGLNLRALLAQRGNLYPGHLLPICEQLCDALQATHEKGFIHRDLKPENLFVLRRPPLPTLKVVDFGLAKLCGPQPMDLTQSGLLIGTPAYMSPEQCKGEEVDARTDIYALGVILYELSTGCLPFAHPSPLQVLSMQICDEPYPPSGLAPLSPAFEAVVLKALAKHPAERYQSAQALRQALRQAIPEPLPWTEELLAAQPAAGPPVKGRGKRISPPIVVSYSSKDLAIPITMVLHGQHPRLDTRDLPVRVTPEPALDDTPELEEHDIKTAVTPFVLGAANQELRTILQELLASSSDVIGVALVNLAGFTIASAAPSEIEQELIGGLAAALLGVSERISDELMRAPMVQTYVKSERGYVIIHDIGSDCLLTLLVTRKAKLGLILLEVKRRIAALAQV